MSEDMNEHTPHWTPDTVEALAKVYTEWAGDKRAIGDIAKAKAYEATASAFTWALERIDTLSRLDREAATHVETLICMRTHFTGDPPYVGWKGLGLALKEHLDRIEAERDAANARADAAIEQAALSIEPANGSPCGCIEEYQGTWMHHCDCGNGGDQDEAQSWCEAKNNARRIRALKEAGK